MVGIESIFSLGCKNFIAGTSSIILLLRYLFSRVYLQQRIFAG